MIDEGAGTDFGAIAAMVARRQSAIAAQVAAQVAATTAEEISFVQVHTGSRRLPTSVLAAIAAEGRSYSAAAIVVNRPSPVPRIIREREVGGWLKHLARAFLRGERLEAFHALRLDLEHEIFGAEHDGEVGWARWYRLRARPALVWHLFKDLCLERLVAFVRSFFRGA